MTNNSEDSAAGGNSKTRNPPYPFFGTLFDGLKFTSDYKPVSQSDALKQEVFLFYFLVSLLFIAESYIWFNGFDSFLRNYLNSQYSLPPTVELRAVLIGILVAIVLFNGLKLLFLLMMPFSHAASLIVSMFNRHDEQKAGGTPKPTKTAKQHLDDAVVEIKKSLISGLESTIGSLVNVLQISFAGALFYLVSGGSSASRNAEKVCKAGKGVLDTIVCLRDEILSKQLPCVSMLVLLLTFVFAGAFAAVEIGLFRADFGPEFEDNPQEKISRTNKFFVFSLIILGVISVALIGIYLQQKFLLMVAMIFLYLTIALIIIIWSAVRFGTKGTVSYYLRILTIFISILITGFSLDVVFYNEPIDHLFKLYESASIAERMKVKLRQLGDIPPDPSQASSISVANARRGSLWNSLETCIGGITHTPSTSAAGQPVNVIGQPANGEKTIIDKITRIKVRARAKELKIYSNEFSSEGISPLTCYKDYYADRDQYHATRALLRIAKILQYPKLNPNLNLTQENALGDKYEFWRKEQITQGVDLRTLGTGLGPLSTEMYLNAIYYDDRDAYCSRFRQEMIDCFKNEQFLQEVKLYQYIAANLPEAETQNNAGKEGRAKDEQAENSKSIFSPMAAFLDTKRNNEEAVKKASQEPHLIWEWMAKDCRELTAANCNFSQPKTNDKKTKKLDTNAQGQPAQQGSKQELSVSQEPDPNLVMNCMLLDNDLCIHRYPSLVERNRYKELYMVLATYERVPVRIEAANENEIITIRKGINDKKTAIASLVFAKTEALVALLASLLQILVIISKLIISPSVYKTILKAHQDAINNGNSSSNPVTESSAGRASATQSHPLPPPGYSSS